MKFTDLNPKWIGNATGNSHAFVEFECPKQHAAPGMSDMKCIVVLPVWPQENGWTAVDDEFDTITLQPSIWHHCSEDPHFFVRSGQIVFA